MLLSCDNFGPIQISFTQDGSIVDFQAMIHIQKDEILDSSSHFEVGSDYLKIIGFFHNDCLDSSNALDVIDDKFFHTLQVNVLEFVA